VNVVVAHEYANVFEGVSYVRPIIVKQNWWHGIPVAVQLCRNMGIEPVVTQCFGREWGIELARWSNYTHSMWDRVGQWQHYKTSPPLFDRRNETREARLAKQHMTGKPALLMNFAGVSSPFPEFQSVSAAIRAACANRCSVVDLSLIHAYRIYDLLGLYDRALGLVTSDTATLHLAAASDIPYIAFTVDGWTTSVPKGNVKLEIKYSQARQRMPEFLNVLKKMIP
jgi:hypothetical protein